MLPISQISNLVALAILQDFILKSLTLFDEIEKKNSDPAVKEILAEQRKTIVKKLNEATERLEKLDKSKALHEAAQALCEVPAGSHAEKILKSAFNKAAKKAKVSDQQALQILHGYADKKKNDNSPQSVPTQKNPAPVQKKK